MSWLLFSRQTGRLSLFAGKNLGIFASAQLGVWSAHNNTASTSGGRWPSGQFIWSHYKPHAEAGYRPACLPTAYGCMGIHVFEVPNRFGMGVHAGRSIYMEKIGGKTLGCVRTSDDAMAYINQTHQLDPIVGLIIQN